MNEKRKQVQKSKLRNLERKTGLPIGIRIRSSAPGRKKCPASYLFRFQVWEEMFPDL
jgi:hypothetical protein